MRRQGKINVPVAGDDGCRVDLVPHEVVGPAQEFGRQQNDRGRTISNLFVLLRGE